MISFWILWSINALITFALVYFFYIGLNEDYDFVSIEPIIAYLGILTLAVGVQLGSMWLKSNNYLTAAKITLVLFALPGLLFVLHLLDILV